MTGKLEKTNESYALSKIVSKMSSILINDFKQDIVCLMPTNLYGINDTLILNQVMLYQDFPKFLKAKKNKLQLRYGDQVNLLGNFYM